MSYAEPPASKPAVTPVGQIIDESLQPAGQKARIEHINAQVHVSPEVRDVLVDSAQVVVAVASIIANSLESYTDPLGPIKITAEPANGGLRLQVSDLGCGMDEATVRKATSPFFSAKPASRRRGMGLAYAGRLIRLNRGNLEINSARTTEQRSQSRCRAGRLPTPPPPAYFGVEIAKNTYFAQVSAVGSVLYTGVYDWGLAAGSPVRPLLDRPPSAIDPHWGALVRRKASHWASLQSQGLTQDEQWGEAGF